MSQKSLEDVLEFMPKIAKVVNGFESETVQVEVYRTLMDSFLNDGIGDGNPERKTSSGKSKSRRNINPSKSAEKSNDDNDNSAVDTNDIINTLKERQDFQKLSENILHKRDLWNKIQLILFYADTPMTSGEIQSVLAGFDLKPDVAAVSKKLKSKHANLITTGPRKKGAINRYKLSGPAKSKAEEWLNEIIG